MLRPLLAAGALVALLAPAGAPAESAAPGADPVLARLVDESLAARPELKAARERARAERDRIPQAGALPDPVLSLGVVNDSTERWMVGEMETSYWQIMLSQGIPWPGKLLLRADAARLAAEQAESAADRALLSAEADVRRGHLDLLLVRDRLALLDQLEAIWQKSAGVARARYEAGEGAQSDVLRAQLELNRLRQRRWGLQADERLRLQQLNRLRARPLDEPIPTSRRTGDLPLPALLGPEEALARAAARSPELAQARRDAALGDNALAQARRGFVPDVTLTAGLMPRGDFPTMWQASVAFNLPLWGWWKQAKAVGEAGARASASAQGAASVEQLLALRVAERRAALEALLETVRLYRDGLLVQSQATAESTLAQYRVGRVTFASVLDANAGYVADQEGLLVAIADAIRIGIADDEVSLEPGGGSLAPSAMASSPVPGAGASGGAPRAAAGPGGPAADAGGGGAAMSGM